VEPGKPGRHPLEYPTVAVRIFERDKGTVIEAVGVRAIYANVDTRKSASSPVSAVKYLACLGAIRDKRRCAASISETIKSRPYDFDRIGLARFLVFLAVIFLWLSGFGLELGINTSAANRRTRGSELKEFWWNIGSEAGHLAVANANAMREQVKLTAHQTKDVIESDGSATLRTRTPSLQCTCLSALLLLVSTSTRLVSGFSAATWSIPDKSPEDAKIRAPLCISFE